MKAKINYVLKVDKEFVTMKVDKYHLVGTVEFEFTDEEYLHDILVKGYDILIKGLKKDKRDSKEKKIKKLWKKAKGNDILEDFFKYKVKDPIFIFKVKELRLEQPIHYREVYSGEDEYVYDVYLTKI